MPGVDQAQVGQRAAIQRRHFAGFVMRLCCAAFKVFGKWGDQFLSLPNHDVIGIAMQICETAGDRSTHDGTYSVGTAPSQDDKQIVLLHQHAAD